MKIQLLRSALIISFVFGILPFIQAQTAERPEIYCRHFVFGYPYGTPASNDLIIREGYAMSNNDDTKFADWLAYLVDSTSMSGSGRKRSWKSDPWLDRDETLESSDYKAANAVLKTDRGHQAPLASMDGYDSYFEANFLSNITPQKSNLNQGVWKKLEDAVRKRVLSEGPLYVMTGPLYEKEMPKLPECDEPHKVPSGYWKIVVKVNGKNDLDVKAYIYDQETPRSATIESGLVSVDEIERRCGLDFFWLLSDKLEQTLEKSVN